MTSSLHTYTETENTGWWIYTEKYHDEIIHVHSCCSMKEIEIEQWRHCQRVIYKYVMTPYYSVTVTQSIFLIVL